MYYVNLNTRLRLSKSNNVWHEKKLKISQTDILFIHNHKIFMAYNIRVAIMLDMIDVDGKIISVYEETCSRDCGDYR